MSDINPGQLVETINWKADRDLKNLDNQGSSFIVCPGMVTIWVGTTIPEGYLLCDGSAVSRTTYSALFSAIGTTYGPGDSSSTFNLPNYSDERTIVKTYSAGASWYRLWSDGWIEQGGVAAAGNSVTVTFPEAFKNTNYTVCATSLGVKGDIYMVNVLTKVQEHKWYLRMPVELQLYKNLGKLADIHLIP
jgi:hypothetical protein